MKILGSGKVDDFKKVAFSDRVMNNLDVKPGDSVIFYKKKGENGVSMFRAEGSDLTSECDSPTRLHLREAPAKLRVNIFASIGFAILAAAMSVVTLINSNLIVTIIAILSSVLAVAFMVLGFLITKKMDDPSDGQALVTVGSIYSKNRLAGISKLSTDGYVVSGDLFINSLFSTNPSKVEVVFKFDNGTEVLALCKCTKSVPGYNVYKIRMKASTLDAGKMFVNISYIYDGKTIDVTATYLVGADTGSQDIQLTETEVIPTIKFDKTLNDKVFDEALFDPEEEDL